MRGRKQSFAKNRRWGGGGVNEALCPRKKQGGVTRTRGGNMIDIWGGKGGKGNLGKLED